MADQNLEKVVDALSSTRLARDLLETGGDHALALHAHDRRQLQVGTAAWQRILYAELVTRTAIAGQLARAYGPEWHVPESGLWPVLNDRATSSLESAIDKAPGTASAPQVVEHTTFDFWRFLLRSQYQTSIWRKYACRATFPQHGNDRQGIERYVARIYDQRNLIAHHHKITRSPADLHADCRYVVHAASADTATHFDDLFPDYRARL